jgi:hypothetical protein
MLTSLADHASAPSSRSAGQGQGTNILSLSISDLKLFALAATDLDPGAQACRQATCPVISHVLATHPYPPDAAAIIGKWIAQSRTKMIPRIFLRLLLIEAFS